jgi:hypothetical protein
VSEHADVDESAPMSFAELADAFTRVVGADAPFTALPSPGMLRRMTGGNTRLADRYRQGRVFLVGDAAHVHSAIGGNGLNLGLQDAVNLAWKLAAALAGWAPPGLLDTYESERRPAGERVTMQTTAQGVLVGPGPEITALRALFGELLADESVLRRIAGLISGADIVYPGTSRWSAEGVTADARPLLVDASTDGRHARAAAPWTGRVSIVAGGEASVLVRPDGYVAWEEGPGLEAALTRWFGPAS